MSLTQKHVNSILIVVVQGMNVLETNNDVRLATTNAIYNVLDFAQMNFENDNDI
jgi:importin subunit beta-1